MSTKPDGGPAFPEIINIESMPVSDLDRGGRLVHPVARHGGMTLRDWFAGMASQGIHASISEGWPEPEEIAKKSYEYADAMLAERNK